jgi:hypothetical protein
MIFIIVYCLKHAKIQAGMENEYWITRFVFQRGIALIYLMGFVSVVNQFSALCGKNGILPVNNFLKLINFSDAPSLFWFSSSDNSFMIAGWIGVVLSAAALLGFSDSLGIYVSVAVWGLLWLLYLSFVNVGQTFYSFGWETLLLESGFLTIFLGSNDTKTPVIVIWLLRWVLFRLMFGAGLIKIRGDECWRNLTCMVYHYETQPIPNPLSWYFHRMPLNVQKGSVLFNHFVELIVPWGYFIPGLTAFLCGLITIVFQSILIISGNFSWLNYLTIVLCIPCFSDKYLSFLPLKAAGDLLIYKSHAFAVYVLAAVILLLSIKPVLNLFSSRQIMNTSFDPIHLVNTYGAFGSITKIRREIIIEGSEGGTEESDWKEYEFKAKPGDINRQPPIISPYHLRLDWLMWFAPMSPCEYNPWFLRFLGKLLEGDEAVISLMAKNPFPGKTPRYLRTTLYEYHFTTPEEKEKTGAIWKRTKLGLYCPVLENRNVH